MAAVCWGQKGDPGLSAASPAVQQERFSPVGAMLRTHLLQDKTQFPKIRSATDCCRLSVMRNSSTINARPSDLKGDKTL